MENNVCAVYLARVMISMREGGAAGVFIITCEERTTAVAAAGGGRGGCYPGNW